jgi:hypothetical protein
VHLGLAIDARMGRALKAFAGKVRNELALVVIGTSRAPKLGGALSLVCVRVRLGLPAHRSHVSQLRRR